MIELDSTVHSNVPAGIYAEQALRKLGIDASGLSAHAGHFVTLTFLNHDDGVPSTPTFTLVDDVSLT